MLRGESTWADECRVSERVMRPLAMWESDVECWTFYRSLAIIRKKTGKGPEEGKVPTG